MFNSLNDVSSSIFFLFSFFFFSFFFFFGMVFVRRFTQNLNRWKSFNWKLKRCVLLFVYPIGFYGRLLVIMMHKIWKCVLWKTAKENYLELIFSILYSSGSYKNFQEFFSKISYIFCYLVMRKFPGLKWNIYHGIYCPKCYFVSGISRLSNIRLILKCRKYLNWPILLLKQI